jgi:CheY-like chemotaxis protein
VALLDMQMPDLDGVQLAQEIRQRFANQKLPLVRVTSMGAFRATLTADATRLHKRAALG